ncbi:MAG: SAM-dependent methyltransferase [Proteobacteria bacterium]|nr:SAM-dependent methyltransferase [Pseudomonadota bacterium]
MDLEAGSFEGYELVDSGNGRKLELFGGVLIDRPSPQAIWPSNKSAPWNKAQAVFKRGRDGTGDWQVNSSKVQDSWQANIHDLKFEIRLTGFGNVGLFPEHASHWTWMAEKLGHRDRAEILNLFAYTGGASIACAKSKARVTHVDAAKSVNSWAMVNADAAKAPKDAIRYIADDALKFAKRETRRGRRYDGIIIDPPTYGRGPKAEVWKIERDLYALCEVCHTLISSNPSFALLTSHSPGVTPRVLQSMLSPFKGEIETGEMLLKGGGPDLPAGAYARWMPHRA